MDEDTAATDREMETTERVTTFLTPAQKERFRAECAREDRSELRQARVLILRWFDALDAQRASEAAQTAASDEPLAA